MKYAIGLDVGGTKIHTVIVEWDKNFLRARKAPRILKSRRIQIENKKDSGKFFQEIVREIEISIKEVGEKNVERVGVGIAGPLNKDKVVLNPANIPFRNFPILRRLASRFSIPLYVDNDANCFTWGEYLFGAGRNAVSIAGITLGTGVGGGIVLDCRGNPLLWDGHYGGAAEVGNMILDGEHDFEYLCSSHAQYLWKGRDPRIIEDEARRGDKKAQEAYRIFGFWLGVGIANIVSVIEPEMIVIGGSLSKAWDVFFEAMEKSSRAYILSPEAKKTKIIRAKLQDDAGALGAAYLLN